MSEDQIGRTVVTEAAESTEGTGPAAIELSEQGDTAVVRLRGPVGVALTPRLRDALTWAVRHYRAVFVDLAAVSAIDATGLSALTRAQGRAIGLGSTLCLVAPSPPVLSALRALHLGEVFAVVDTVPMTRRRPHSGAYRWFRHARS